MKKTIALFLSANFAFSQVPDKVSLISKNKDTLWLADNQLGHTIGQVWDFKSDYKNPPTIIYVKDLSKITASSRRRKKK